MFLIAMFVCWVITMFIWLLCLLGATPSVGVYSPWLAFFACLITGVIVLLGKSWPKTTA